MKKFVVLFAALALFAAACGGGGSSSSASDWCDFDQEVEGLNDEFQEVDIFNPDSAEEAFTEFVNIIENAEGSAPEEIEDDVAVMAEAFKEFVSVMEEADWDFLNVSEADIGGLSSPEVQEASDNISAYGDENCGGGSSDDSDSESDSDSGDEPADEPADEPEVEEEPADPADSDSSEDSGDDPESEIDDTLRQVLVDSFVQSGMTEEQANCMIDKVNLQELASGEFDPLEFLDFYEQCGVDFTQLN